MSLSLLSLVVIAMHLERSNVFERKTEGNGLGVVVDDPGRREPRMS